MLTAAGCSSEDDRRYDPPPPINPNPPRSATVTIPGTVSPSGSAYAPPLRRTAVTSVNETDGLLGLELDHRQELLAFQAMRTPAGTVIHARSLVPADEQLKPALAALQSLGFKADGAAGAPIWTYTISADGRPAFDVRLSAELQAASARLEAAANRLKRSQPGRMLKSDDAAAGFLPRRLVYTGQPLDIAFADSSTDPHWFVAVKSNADGRAYLRGGRLYVAEDGTLRIENYALAADLPAIPKDTDQLRIGADGRVLAVRRDGISEALGRLPLINVPALQNEKVSLSDDGLIVLDGDRAPSYELAASEAPVRAGHLEYPAPDRAAEVKKLAAELTVRRALESLSVTLANPLASAKAGEEPVVIYADVPWSERHLKALGIPVEHTAGHTTLMVDGDPHKLSAALAKVLQVLRVRMNIHDQNLRNADRVRDADNRLNPYRRKTLTIDAQGEAVEGDDPAPFPKTFKPGDPNADAEGFINLPNVNRAVETAEFQAAREEYKLIRAAAERLEPHSIFPDPPAIPQPTQKD